MRRARTLRAVQKRLPYPPSFLNAGVHSDLETICLKCLRKPPGQRYATAAALADDLGRFLRNEPIEARPMTVLDRLVHVIQRPAHLEEVGRWGPAALAAAAAHLVGHGVIFGLIRTNQPVGLFWLWLLGYEALAFGLFWHLLRRRGGALTETEPHRTAKAAAVQTVRLAATIRV